ncbi:Positive regulator of purine utilization [Tolypocladium ophioglossoides CBS 100239]|uniref:Positive regulator of purine utilization n=1 Tax=Tolypocladium ophioglossoides (strain CBS 100239) TaxID=1163406 RepID=A0A0L0N3I3_TOLOC|nr:Positive regulator of purine utilization [Tolypocladium ophioglossoides CBS 100239]
MDDNQISAFPLLRTSSSTGQAHTSQAWTPELPADEPRIPDSGNYAEAAAQATIATVLSLRRGRPGPEVSFSKLLLTEIMSPTKAMQLPENQATGQDGECDEQFSSGIVGGLDTTPVSLPTMAAAKSIVKVYFQFSSLGMPLIHEPTFERKLELLYGMPRTINLAETHASTEARIAVFFVLEALAVALLSMHKRDPSRIPTWLADRYHETAILALMETGLPTGVEGVQALLLVGQYSYHHPTCWVVWKIVGAAVRLAVELGLHQDHSAEQLDALTLDTMRRTFWVAYGMDRNISITMSLPPCLPDGAISAQFPSEVDDNLITQNEIGSAEARPTGFKCVSLHIFQYRQIQSEMQTVLTQSPSTPYVSINLGQWQDNMHARIEKWSNSAPKGQSLSIYERTLVETFELTYHTALFYLYRPSRNCPSPSDSRLLAMAQAAIHMIQLYRRFFRERKLTVYWLAVENLSSAGNGLMLGYVQSLHVREHITFHSLESLIHTCSSILWGVVERFPAFQGKRDAFDATAWSVLADLRSKNSDTDAAVDLPMQDDSSSGRRSRVNAAGSIDFAAQASQAQAPPEEVRMRQPDSAFTSTTEFSAMLQPQILSSTTDPSANTCRNTQSPSFEDMDLSLVWEAMADFNETYTPTWI